MIVYLLQVAFFLAVGWLFYHLVLSKLTFFSLNRFFFILWCALSFVFPFQKIPHYFSIRSLISFENPALLPQIEKTNQVNAPIDIPELSWADNGITPIKPGWDMYDWTMILYFTGVLILCINFFIQLLSLFYKRWKLPAIKDKCVIILEEPGERSPGSFWKYIFINPAKYEWDTYQQILAHEKVHIQKKHTLDLILAEVLVILQWFNPFAWFIRQSMEANLEYQTDDYLVSHKVTDIETYQQNLLKVAIPSQLLRLQSAYNQSILQKRIRMMHQPKSGLHHCWKYITLGPVLLLLLSLVNQPVWPALQVMPKETGNVITPVMKSNTVRVDSHVNILVSRKQEQKNNLLTDSMKQKLVKTYQPVMDTVSATATPPANEVALPYTGYSFDEVTKLNKAGISSSLLTGYQNTMRNTWSVDELIQLHRSGIKPALIQGYEQIGITNLSVVTLLKLQQRKLTPRVIQGYQEVGLTKVSLDTLYYLKLNNVTPAIIQGFQNVGFGNLSFYQLTKLKQQEITASFIRSFQSIGFKDITPEQVTGLRKKNITASEVSRLVSQGVKIGSIDELLK